MFFFKCRRGGKTLKKTIITFAISGILLANPLLVQAELGDQVLKFGMNHEDIKLFKNI